MLKPNRYFARITCIDIQRDLLDRGYTNVLLDIDNTVRSRATHDVPADVRAWLDDARAAGIKLCLLSNSWHKNVFSFSEQVGIPVVAKSCKPLVHGYFQACAKLGAKKRNTVMVGDQILTDVLGAHLIGMECYLVVPLSDINIKSALWQRNLEARILAGWNPEGDYAGE